MRNGMSIPQTYQGFVVGAVYQRLPAKRRDDVFDGVEVLL